MKLWRTTPTPLPLARPRPSQASLEASTRPSHRGPFHFGLFALTLFSMMAAGAAQQGVDPFATLGSLVHLVEGLPFAATLLGILTVHEFGHYFAARKWGVKASLPYFIPMPHYLSFLGTLGAVIRIRSAIPHKRALMDIGAAGPLAGFVIAVGACLIGLSHSLPVGPDYFDPRFHPNPIGLGSPLLFSALSALSGPSIEIGQTILLSPVAFAGWVGLFITAFNLFPIGQLDGGHIVYALFDNKHRLIGRITYLLLLVMGLYGILSLIWDWPQGWPGWLVLAFFLSFFGRNHPDPYDSTIPLDRKRRFVGYLCLLIFAMCFAPVPFRP